MIFIRGAKQISTPLDKNSNQVPTVVVSFDHPEKKKPLEEQVSAAQQYFQNREMHLKEFLIKPEESDQNYVPIESILTKIQLLSQFDIIGLTDKELGASTLNRMVNIAKIRRALKNAGIEIPIHIFGGLDTINTPLYFLAGADIFDGLTWARFAFFEGLTIYQQNCAALNFGIKTSDNLVTSRCRNQNIYYLEKLQMEMCQHLNDGNFSSFKYISKRLEEGWEALRTQLGA